MAKVSKATKPPSDDKECKSIGEDDEKIVFRSFITLRNGKRLYAKACGRRAFPIKV